MAESVLTSSSSVRLLSSTCSTARRHGAALHSGARGFHVKPTRSGRFGVGDGRVYTLPTPVIAFRAVGGDGRDGVGLISQRRQWPRAGRLTASSAAEVAGAVEEDGFLRSKLAVFVSGGGSNFRALHESMLKNLIYGDVTVVVSDKPGCKGCEYARQHGIPVLTFPSSKQAPDGLSAPDLVSSLRNHGIDYILLAGYLKLLPSELVQAYPRSILNIHPALLPAFGGKGFYGRKVHEAVIKSGARFSGATIHFVDEHFDTGPILAQRVVPVLDGDSPQDLANRVLKVEHVLYSEAVAALCEDRIFWRRDGVPLIRKSWDEATYY